MAELKRSHYRAMRERYFHTAEKQVRVGFKKYLELNECEIRWLACMFFVAVIVMGRLMLYLKMYVQYANFEYFPT